MCGSSRPLSAVGSPELGQEVGERERDPVIGKHLVAPIGIATQNHGNRTLDLVVRASPVADGPRQSLPLRSPSHWSSPWSRAWFLLLLSASRRSCTCYCQGCSSWSFLDRVPPLHRQLRRPQSPDQRRISRASLRSPGRDGQELAQRDRVPLRLGGQMPRRAVLLGAPVCPLVNVPVAAETASQRTSPPTRTGTASCCLRAAARATI